MRWSLVLGLFFSAGCLDFLKEEPEEEEESQGREEGKQQGDCLDGVDNDEDGDIDCDDSGCDGKPACESDDTSIIDSGEDTDIDTGEDTDTNDTEDPIHENPENGDCWDGIDNDQDGDLDCDDSDCADIPECNPEVIDNDGDGYPDIDDCEPYNANAHPGASEQENNGIDDDCDGYVDETLIEAGTDCSDGIDNDLDGVSDCDDLDCTSHSSCVVNVICEDTCIDAFGFGFGAPNNGQCEDGGVGDTVSNILGFPISFCQLGTDCSDCGNRIDADGDLHEDNPAGGTLFWDCDDSDANVNSSATEVAGNGIDDDCDGSVDEGGGSSSSETDCSNGVDDDQDGATDCNDSDCSSDPACSSGGTTICTNTCSYASDGDCDDGGPNNDYSLCDYGSDCNDCGVRDVCMDTCATANDGTCNDSGLGGDGTCDRGTDCGDCGSY